MSVRAGQDASAVTALVTERWAALDGLLPVPPALAGSGVLAVPGAAGRCEHWAGEPGSLDLAWGAARRFRLEPQVAGPDVRGALDQLLTGWREHLAGLPGTGEDDTAAVVPWPSRDIAGHRMLLDHGLIPLAIIAARPAGRDGRAVRPGPGLRIRPALPTWTAWPRWAWRRSGTTRTSARSSSGRTARPRSAARSRPGWPARRRGPGWPSATAARSARCTHSGRTRRAGSRRWWGRPRWPTWN